MVEFFTNFRAKRNPNGWVTHGMMHACHVGDTWHVACMPCGFVQSIKTGSVEEKEEKTNEKKGGDKEREEGRFDSFFLRILAFQRSEFVRPRVKVGYTPRGKDFFVLWLIST